MSKSYDTPVTHTQTVMPKISVQPLLCTLSERYASRGIVKAVQKDAEEQCEKERQSRSLAPLAYRLSELPESAVRERYCHGEGDSMTASDLLQYFEETRTMRLQDADFSKEEDPDLSAKVEVLPLERSCSEPELSSTSKKRVRDQICDFFARAPKWFDTRAVDLSAERRTFPLSALAAIVAVAASLMLIVAGSVMVTQAESNLASVEKKIEQVSSEIAEINADLNIQHDLLQIREIAIREYGMVSEEYVRMDYISLKSEDKVETFEEETETDLTLGALLSAIGAQK